MPRCPNGTRRNKKTGRCEPKKTGTLRNKTTSSKKVELVDKLNQAKAKLEELYGIYPHLNPTLAEHECNQQLQLYEAIIGLT